ncbi:MAG: T9SS type A sorting domain-containing protein [Chitinophagaceae bacterium]
MKRIFVFRFILFYLFCSAFTASAQIGHDIIGIPSTGARGIKVSVAELENLTRAVDRLPKPIRIRKEFESHRRPASNPAAQQVASWPMTGNPQGNRADQVTASQAIHSNFLGINIGESGFIPPDSNGDVSTTQVGVTSNGRIKFYNLNTVCQAAQTTASTGTTPLGSPVVDLDMDVFFNSVRNGTSTTDPHIRFDRLTGKWFVVAINVAATSNRCVIAVSSGPTVTSAASFTFFFFVYDAIGSPPVSPAGYIGGFFDYPTLGIDANALYIGGNMFNSAGTTYFGATLFVVRKSSVTGAGPIVTTAFHLIGTGTAGIYTGQGVDNDDPSATAGYFVGVDAGIFSQLDIHRIATPGGTPVASSLITLTVPTTTSPQLQPQNGSPPRTLDGLDDRLFAAMIRKNKITGTSSLWTAHNMEVNASGVASGTGNRNGSRWYQIDNLASTPTLTQSGTLFDNAASNPRGFWIPSIATSGQGHSILGFSTAASDQFADCGIAGRYRTDVTGTLQAFTLATTSTTHYDQSGSPERWGDYSQVVIDPADDMTMWTFQEYCNGTNNWGVRAIQLKAPPPASPTSPGTIACGNDIGGGNHTTAVTLNGTSSSNSEFFDPGTGYPNRLAVTTTGTGVSISSLVFVSTTQLSFNVTWPTTLAGTSQTLTITNPDCQSVTTTYTLPAGCSPVPVYYISFTGRDIGRRAQLNWVTASEPSNAYFEIERKNVNGEWVVIGTMNSKGVNGGGYVFFDENPLAVNFYRLKQYDIDRNFTYSPIVVVEMNVTDRLIIYPNPAKEQLNVEVPENYRGGTLKLINVSGASVFSSRINTFNKQIIDVSLLASGTYIVEIESVQGQRLQKTVIVQKRDPRP